MVHFDKFSFIVESFTYLTSLPVISNAAYFCCILPTDV